jgi:hypothetical protein
VDLQLHFQGLSSGLVSGLNRWNQGFSSGCGEGFEPRIFSYERPGRQNPTESGTLWFWSLCLQTRTAMIQQCSIGTNVRLLSAFREKSAVCSCSKALRGSQVTSLLLARKTVSSNRQG